MLLAPFKALYSVKFYLQAIKKPGPAPAVFLAYLFVICAVFITGAAYISAKPQINHFIERLAFYTPDITVENGKITVNDDRPLTIAPDELKGYKIYFDTGSEEPVYPTQMEQARTIISVNAHTAYFKMQDNFQEVKAPGKEAKFSLSGEDVLKNKQNMARLIFWLLAIMLVLAQLFKLPFMLLLGFITAAVFNGATNANMRAMDLLKLSCYMQAPVAAAYILNTAAPVKIRFMTFIYIAIFALYSYLVFSARFKEAANAPAPEA